MSARPKTLIVHSPEYANWKFSDDHPTQGRRFINGFNAITEKFNTAGISYDVVAPRLVTESELLRVHSQRFIDEVTKEFTCSEWRGPRQDLATYAQLFAGGTLVALDGLLSGQYTTAIHLPSAKHHAQYDHASGFCVFNDFALAADIATKDHGLRIAILDIDAHHGDGVENLTRTNPNVLTFSIHEQGIFPGTGNENQPENNVFNYPLNSATGLGDRSLLAGVSKFLPIARAFSPDLLFITSGADGLADDPLTHLQYTVEGYAAAAELVASEFSTTPILMGGAGGYLPDDGTPKVWGAVGSVLTLNTFFRN